MALQAMTLWVIRQLIYSADGFCRRSTNFKAVNPCLLFNIQIAVPLGLLLIKLRPLMITVFCIGLIQSKALQVPHVSLLPGISLLFIKGRYIDGLIQSALIWEYLSLVFLNSRGSRRF